MNYLYTIPSNFKFGGCLILLHEIYNLEKNSKNTKLYLIGEKKFQKYFKINKYLKSNIKIVNKISKKDSYINLNKLVLKKINYSFSFLNNIKKKINYISFKKNYIREVKKYLKNKKIKKYISVHLKADTNILGNTPIREWKKYVEHLSSKKKVFLVHSNYFKKHFKDNKNVLFLEAKYQNKIYFEPIIALLSKGFIGNASGFCTYLNLSNTKYLILKNPKQHKNMFKYETKNLRLGFANKHQYIIKTKQNFKNIKKHEKKIF